MTSIKSSTWVPVLILSALFGACSTSGKIPPPSSRTNKTAHAYTRPPSKKGGSVARPGPAASNTPATRPAKPSPTVVPTPPNPGVAGKPDDAAVLFRKDIVNEATKYRGLPYKYAGKDPSTGFDCSGFTSYVLGKYGVRVSPASAVQATEGVEVPLSQVKPGDLIIFRTEDGSRVQHVAMVTENKPDGIYCVHSTTSRGVVVDNISTSSYWKPRIWKARDVIGR